MSRDRDVSHSNYDGNHHNGVGGGDFYTGQQAHYAINQYAPTDTGDFNEDSAPPLSYHRFAVQSNYGDGRAAIGAAVSAPTAATSSSAEDDPRNVSLTPSARALPPVTNLGDGGHSPFLSLVSKIFEGDEPPTHRWPAVRQPDFEGDTSQHRAASPRVGHAAFAVRAGHEDDGDGGSKLASSAAPAVIPASPTAEPPSLNRVAPQDYPVKPWMVKKGLVHANYRCPYQYSRTMMGRFGIINYDYSGDFAAGAMVLCFHGLNATRLTFDDIQAVCGRHNFFVVTFDLYGHGLSANPMYQPCVCGPDGCKTYSVDFYVKQAEELLAHLKSSDRPLSVVGFSMGGVIAARYAATHAATVERLVLISSAGVLGSPPTAVRALRYCSCCVCCCPSYLLFCCGANCQCCCWSSRAVARLRAAFSSKLSDEEIRAGVGDALWNRLVWQLLIKRGAVEAFLGSVLHVPMWAGEKHFQAVGALRIPVLILWGGQDMVAPASCAARILECIPNATLVTFERSTHLLLADEQVATAALLLTFLDFPRTAELSQWRYLLPYTPQGVYVSRDARKPPEFATPDEFLAHIGYRPRLFVKLAPAARKSGRRQSRQRGI